jgi:hypothetical protein
MAVDPVTAGLTLVDSVVSRIWPDATEAQKLELQGLLAVHATNTAEAQSPHLFVAGWRPFIGWASGVGVVYALLIQPFGSWVAATSGQPPLPVLDTSVLTTLVMTMLGFGGLRTLEGLKGTKRSTWK